MKIASKREKRSAENYRGQLPRTLRRPRSIFKRDNRDYTEIDEAYSKYYESIKARYRNYVKNLFQASRDRNRHMVSNNTVPVQSANDLKNARKGQDGRWLSYNNPEFRYRSNKFRALNTEQQTDDDIEPAGPPVALPSINDPIRMNRYEVESAADPPPNVSNYYPRFIQTHDKVDEPERRVNSTADLLLAQLQSDMMRKKRDTSDDDGKGDDDGDAVGGKGRKNRGPCEPLIKEEHMQIEVVKPPKVQNETFGHGMVLKITCDAGFNLNVQTANSTVRCNKGHWKPAKPSCSLSE